MNILWHQVLLLILTTWWITVVATATLDGWYYVNKDDPSLGGCTEDQAAWLEQAYEEAVEMIEGAIEAIAFVQTKRNPLIPAEAFRWDKIYVELLQMFDVSVHAFGRIMDPSERTRLGDVVSKTHKSKCIAPIGPFTWSLV